MSSVVVNPYVSFPASGTPPLPAFDNPLLVAGLWNFNPVGYPPTGDGDHNLVEGVASAESLGTAPYPVDYVYLILNAGDNPPYITTALDDQNAVNPLVQNTSALRPVLQITTPVIVSGGSQPGTYTYRGLSDQGIGPAPYYNLVGHSDDPLAFAIYTNGNWTLVDGSNTLLYASDNDPAFPWQDTWSGGITVTAGTQAGEIQGKTDGQGGSANTGLQSSSNLSLTTTVTFYCYFKLNDLAATGVIFETSANGETTAGAISVRAVAGVLTCSVVDNTGLLLNKKIKTISDNNYHLLSLVIDTGAAAASQVQIWIDGSQTGVTAPISTDLAGETLSNTKLSVFARNNAASQFLACSIQNLLSFTVAHGTSTRQSWENYLLYLPTV